MKRSPELTPLSHDHHHALVVAHALAHTSDHAPGVEMQRWWEEEGSLHFRVEEVIVLPAWWQECREADLRLITRTLAEHNVIREALLGLGEFGLSVAHLVDLGHLLERHIRFEERELFPLIESSLNSESLAAVGKRIEAAERGVRCD